MNHAMTKRDRRGPNHRWGWVTMLALFFAASVAFGQDERALSDETSVKPGINDAFLKHAIDVSQWVERFEREGREVYDRRHKIVEACHLRRGMQVADVGAGTGLFTGLLARAVGTEGKVYAVDIVPAFLENIGKRARDSGLKQIHTVLCTEKSVGLEANSVDRVFVCDTYHHFQYPKHSLASIHRALKPGGELILIDFNRISGKSSDWILKHVRAGKDVVASEIQSAGFEKIEEIKGILNQNYMLRFKKVTGESI